MKVNSTYAPNPNRIRKYDERWPTLMQMFEESSKLYAHRLCFTILDPENSFSMTYEEAVRTIQQVAFVLTQRYRLKSGDHVALCGLNSPEWAIAFFAITCAECVVIPLDPSLSTEKNNTLCTRANAKCIIADEEQLKDGLGVHLGDNKLSLTKTHPLYILDMLNPQSTLSPIPTYGDETLAAILFTSGTTGKEKGVMLTHRNLISDTYGLETNIFFTPDDMFYAILPIHHTYCMQSSLIAPISNGASIAFTKGIVISQMMREMALNKITIIAGIPLLFNKLIQGVFDNIKKKGIIVYSLVRILMFINTISLVFFNKNIGKNILNFVLKKASLSGINLLISGGGPIPPETIKLFNQIGVNCVQGYGLTETSPIITLNPINHNKYKSIGLPTDLADIAIHNANSEGIGEITVKGPMVFEGYYQNPEATAEAFTSDGYFKTGDIGYIDNDGFVYLTGRSKNIIVTEGGKNVSPEEVEDIFQLSKEIEQIMVRGYIISKELNNEGIEAVIYPNFDFFKNKENSHINELILTVVRNGNKRLNSYQRITRIRRIDTPMELTGTKKIRRHTVDKNVGTIIM